MLTADRFLYEVNIMCEQILEKALATDNHDLETVHEQLENIWSALIDFKEQNPQVFKFINENGGELTLADAIQALAQALDVLEN